MVELNEIKEGICLIREHDGIIQEGVVFAKSLTGCTIIWFDLTCNFKRHNYSFMVTNYNNIQLYYQCVNWEFASVPHFCSFENLYEILSKHTDKNEFILYGYGMRGANTENFIYLKTLESNRKNTENNKFLEIAMYTRFDKSVFWINECDFVSDLHLSYNIGYYSNGGKCVEMDFKDRYIKCIAFSDELSLTEQQLKSKVKWNDYTKEEFEDVLTKYE